MEAKLLCVGDMHLGRRPSRLPDHLEGTYGIAPSSLEPRAAWGSAVDLAIEQGVDAVLLAGDVVDSKNGFMEAYGPLLEGARRLERKGIDLVCVAGNHDVEALPRLADELDSVRLLGRRGIWDSHVVCREGEPLVRVIGWSFPKTHVESNPLDAMSADMVAGAYGDGFRDDLRTVGLLHCDLDGGGDRRYAPVTRASLDKVSTVVSAWFLGHIHGPTIRSGGRPVGYLGSLVGLDAGEMGARGPWLAQSGPKGWELKQVALSPLRWESREVQVGDCADGEAIEVAMTRAVQELSEELASNMEGARVVGVRLVLHGVCRVPLVEIRRAMQHAGELDLAFDDVCYFVDKVFDRTRLPVDLSAIAKQKDPAGLMAKRLLDLEAKGEACAVLVAEARPRLEAVACHANFSGLGSTGCADEEVRDVLVRVARRALDELLSQKTERAPAPADLEVGP